MIPSAQYALGLEVRPSGGLVDRALEALRHVIDAGMYGQTPTDGAWQWLLVSAPHSSTPPDLLTTSGPTSNSPAPPSIASAPAPPSR